MSQLFLKCKACGREFPSGIAMPVAMLAVVSLVGNVHQCTWCGATASYDTPDYHGPPLTS